MKYDKWLYTAHGAGDQHGADAEPGGSGARFHLG
jgi:hypothetical protein